MLWRNIGRKLAEPENSGKATLESNVQVRGDTSPGTYQARKEEEERVFQDERVQIERTESGGEQGTSVTLKKV